MQSLDAAIPHQYGAADYVDNACRSVLSLGVAELQVFPEIKRHRRLEAAVDGYVLGVEMRAVKIVADGIEPTLQDRQISGTIRDDDSATVRQSGQRDFQRPIGGFLVTLPMRGEPLGRYEDGHGQLSSKELG